MDWSVSDERLAPQPPKDKSLGIAIVGCGEIANIAHLPAYRAAGLRVVSCFDLDRQAAERTAEKFEIDEVAESLDTLLSNPEVAIVDIAIHMYGRREVFRRACEAGKHILLQKPVAHTMEQAQEYVRRARESGVKYQVNQQARWAGTHRQIKTWIEGGAIGRLNYLRLDMRGWQDDPEKWYVRQENMTLVDHGIHYFDLLRYFSGKEARRVAAMHAFVPGQLHISPVIYAAIVDFGDGLIAEHNFNNKVMTDSPWDMCLYADGEEGSAWCDFERVRLERRDGTRIEAKPTAKWFPDGFLGPMADLMDAIADDREPACSGEINLGTMRLVLGALESAQQGIVRQWAD
ncbi:Gfo/Idh/MocA family oxidoreductase [Fimbriimonadia bacterium ATM]|nr:MAG: gfo/Idh/MocA family oxidoreductase [Armatimonadota bacterium]MBC6970270.1 gfo/Idh/MocA family oxidoreductase [Armatimonadota bacterium]MCE7899550.1 gfo/Idh/MocA family oxidoreductase [Armatimonadetes bacterium ATM1]MDL1927638.1 Gfo/Idh/MocA family oxidoreductase [Fimbriimonadia bacterium ATM]RIJ96434.1 MAG: hypothetical protein DCC45_07180 [Armatimonadota bacterium]